MPGVKGAKQKISLTKIQKQELSSFKEPLLYESLLKDFLRKHKLSFRALKRRASISLPGLKFGYSFQEFDGFLKKCHTKSLVWIKCVKCNHDYVCVLQKLFERKHQEEYCPECYKQTFMYDNLWKANNSQAQTISQNRPDVIRKQKRSQKKRYQNNFSLKERLRQASIKNWNNIEYRQKVFNNGGFVSKSGKYKDYFYQSLLELGFILKCENENVLIENFTLEGIGYKFKNKDHLYFPDFIINKETIIEIKGRGKLYKKFFKKIQEKHKACKKWCEKNNFKFRVVYDTDLESWRKKARKIHEENKNALDINSRPGHINQKTNSS